MTDPLPITPFRRPLRGTVDLPGSKSLTNRALILATLAAGNTTLVGVLFSRDTEIMITALRALGVEIRVDRPAHRVEIEGTGGRWPISEATVDIGNAGTAARFLTALLALHPDGRYTLDGDEAMRRRPMDGLLAALSGQGTAFTHAGEPGFFPFSMQTRGLRGGRIEIDSRASSQFVSALLMAAPCAREPVEMVVSGLRPAFVRITIEMMAAFGVSIPPIDGDCLRVHGGDLLRSPGHYAVEPDVTAASYFLTLPLVTGGVLHLPGLTPHLLQGDAVYAEVAEALGARIERRASDWVVSAEPVAHGGLDRDFHHFSDTFLTLAAIAPLLQGPTTIRGIEHTRRQETDRVAGMAAELRKLGCTVEERPDALHISPRPDALAAAARAGAEIETYEDHRFAMSFAVLGCADLRGDGTPWLRIKDPACCRKSFPAFFDRLAALQAASPV